MLVMMMVVVVAMMVLLGGKCWHGKNHQQKGSSKNFLHGTNLTRPRPIGSDKAPCAQPA
jgi:hypothetical protein